MTACACTGACRTTGKCPSMGGYTAREGWVCPRCASVYSPIMTECSRCNSGKTGALVSTQPIATPSKTEAKTAAEMVMCVTCNEMVRVGSRHKCEEDPNGPCGICGNRYLNHVCIR